MWSDVLIRDNKNNGLHLITQEIQPFKVEDETETVWPSYSIYMLQMPSWFLALRMCVKDL